MPNYFTDLHIHIGRNRQDKPVKITAARNLTLANILNECVERKGIQIIGVVDCASPLVLDDIKALLAAGEIRELPNGGIRYREKVTVILGAEVETPAGTGSAHSLCFFPGLAQMSSFSRDLAKFMTNINLSSQRAASLNLQKLWEMAEYHGGFLIPAHAFTPHKGVYGNCAASLTEVLSSKAIDSIPAIELGLSADSDLADLFSELEDKTFITNSDAHSLPKIGREYNLLQINEPTFTEVVKALRRVEGRRVVGNYGLHPRLGKYHRTHCLRCDQAVEVEPPMVYCPKCGHNQVVMGVLDRIYQVKDREIPDHPAHRPPYHYQVPLQFLPKVGPKTVARLIQHFGSEMEVLHFAPEEELTLVVGQDICSNIIAARQGKLILSVGSGGRYGRVTGPSLEE